MKNSSPVGFQCFKSLALLWDLYLLCLSAEHHDGLTMRLLKISISWRNNSHTDTGGWAVIFLSLFTACVVEGVQGSTFSHGLLLDFPWAVHWRVRPLLLDFAPTSLPLPELVHPTGTAIWWEERGIIHANSSFLLISSAPECSSWCSPSS